MQTSCSFFSFIFKLMGSQFGVVQKNSKAFAYLVQFVGAGVKAVNQTLVRTKQLWSWSTCKWFVWGVKAKGPTTGFCDSGR